DWPIDHSARRRVIAPYPVPSRFATNSATMAGSVNALQNPRVCTSGLSNAPWEELTERRTSSTGTPFSCSIASTGSLPDSRPQVDLEASLRQVVVEIQPSEIFGVHPAGHARGVSVPGHQIKI